MFVTVIALKYALLVSQQSCGHFTVNNTISLHHLTPHIIVGLVYNYRKSIFGRK